MLIASSFLISNELYEEQFISDELFSQCEEDFYNCQTKCELLPQEEIEKCEEECDKKFEECLSAEQ